MPKSKATNTFRVLLPVLFIAILVAAFTTYMLSTEKKAAPELKDSIEIKVGTVIPDFEVSTLKGEKRKFSSLRKKVTLINFWATWCGPCVEEMPSLNRLHAKLKNDGLEIIGVNMDEDPEAVLPAFLKKVPVDFPIFADPDGMLADKLSIGGLPFSFVVDDQNKVLLMELGEREWHEDETQFREWLELSKKEAKNP